MPEYAHRELSTNEDTPSLRAVSDFSSLDYHTLAQLDAAGRYRRCPLRQTIHLAHPIPHSAFVVLSGHARLYHLSSDGRVVTLAPVYAHDMFQGGGATEEAADYVEAMVEGTLLYHIPCAQLWCLLATHPAVAAQVQCHLHQRLVDAYDRIKELALYDVRTRLAHALVWLARRQGDEMVLKTPAQLAALIGARQEDVTRALHYLAALNLIACRPHRRGIVVLDPEGLAMLS